MSGIVVVEPKHMLDESVVTQATLINPEGHAYVCIANVTGYTKHLSKNLEVRQSNEASVVLTEQPSGDASPKKQCHTYAILSVKRDIKICKSCSE